MAPDGSLRSPRYRYWNLEGHQYQQRHGCCWEKDADSHSVQAPPVCREAFPRDQTILTEKRWNPSRFGKPVFHLSILRKVLAQLNSDTPLRSRLQSSLRSVVVDPNQSAAPSAFCCGRKECSLVHMQRSHST